MEELKIKLDRLIEEKGIASEEVLELSRKIDKLIIEFYKRNASALTPANP